MSSRWGDKKTIQFIHLYRENECLWNPNHCLYKNKIARRNAYTEIKEEFNVTIIEIKNKIKSLRSTYHQELNKVKKSKRSGAGSSDVYKPSLAWFKEMDFLNDTFEYRKSIHTEIQPSSQTSTTTVEQPQSSSRTSTTTVEQPQSSSQTRTTTVEQPQSSSRTSTTTVEQPQSSSQTSTTTVEQPQLSSQSSTTTVESPQSSSQAAYKKTVQNKRKRIEQNETSIALQHLENISTAINNPRSNEDEFYYFGQSVAAQLRSLPLNNALDIQSKIQILLSTERARLSASYSQPYTPYSAEDTHACKMEQ